LQKVISVDFENLQKELLYFDEQPNGNLAMKNKTIKVSRHFAVELI
jgi:hypothetical protein